MKHVFVLETDGNGKLTEEDYKTLKSVFQLVGNSVSNNHILCSHINQSKEQAQLIIPNAKKDGSGVGVWQNKEQKLPSLPGQVVGHMC